MFNFCLGWWTNFHAVLNNFDLFLLSRVAESMWWVGCGVYVLGEIEIKASIIPAELELELSLAKGDNLTTTFFQDSIFFLNHTPWWSISANLELSLVQSSPSLLIILTVSLNSIKLFSTLAACLLLSCCVLAACLLRACCVLAALLVDTRLSFNNVTTRLI